MLELNAVFAGVFASLASVFSKLALEDDTATLKLFLQDVDHGISSTFTNVMPPPPNRGCIWCKFDQRRYNTRVVLYGANDQCYFIAWHIYYCFLIASLHVIPPLGFRSLVFSNLHLLKQVTKSPVGSITNIRCKSCYRRYNQKPNPRGSLTYTCV